jgi:predicted DNA-binding transcriptional regulator YafY
MGNRNNDLNVIKWQLKLMMLLPSSVSAKGLTVEDLCKKLIKDEADFVADEPEGKALIHRVQKALKALSLDETWGAMLMRRIEDGPDHMREIFPAEGERTTAKSFWKWKEPKKRTPALPLMIPPQNEDHSLALLMLQKRLKEELPPATLECLEPYFDLARQRIENLGPGNRYLRWQNKVINRPPTQFLSPAKPKKSVQDTVLRALHEDCQLRLMYRRRETPDPVERRVHPLGVVLRGPVSYLVATIDDHPDIRLMAMHRIESAELLRDRKVSVPKGFKLASFVEKGGVDFADHTIASGEIIKLEVEFDAHVVQHLVDSPMSDDQTIQGLNEKWSRLTASVPDTQQLRWWLLGFGPRVKVIAPVILRDWVASEHQGAVQLYTG